MDAKMIPPDVVDNASTLLQLSEEDIVKMTFDSEDDAFQFYSRYAYVIGFSIRRDTTHKDKGTGEIWDRTFVCSRAGFRKKEYLEMPNRQREHRALTRCGCLAKLRVKLDKVHTRYVVTGVVIDHNHPLVPMYGVTKQRSHKHVEDGNRDEANVVHKARGSPSRVMDLCTHEAGGDHRVGYTREDMDNGIDNDLQVDAKVALAYLYGKSDGDPLFFFQHTVGGDNQIDKLFWTDGRSKAEFEVFGDVLIFDTTYKTNSYNLPLIILAGANNHLSTCIFGTALVQNESIDSYKWVLKTFLDVMNRKRPFSVVTDGDNFMQAAIAEVFPDARHRLCKWCLQRDASTNVKIKDFKDIFSCYMCLDCSVDEFEDGWRKMVSEYGLENHKWISEVYEKRHMWAKAYLRGQFFGRVKSSQCCEGINTFLNKPLGSDKKLVDFVRDYNKELERFRINVVNQEVRTNYTMPVLTSALTDLERQASKVYTREVFMKVRKQINLQATLWHQQVLPHSVDSRIYTIADYNTDGLLRHVLFREDGLFLACDCKMFESSGVPCKHMIYVLKCEGLKEIPTSCIHARWTTEFGKDLCDKNLSSATNEGVEIARYGYIISKCNEMVFYAKQTSQGYKEVIDGVDTLTARAKELWMMQEITSSNGVDSPQPAEPIPWFPSLPT